MDTEAIKASIVETVKGRAREFLEENADAREFLEDRARDLAGLVARLAQASLDGNVGEIDALRREIAIVRQTMENELAGIAVAAEARARSTFAEILGTVFDFAKDALPAILAAL